jgi:hypothetical protein
MIRKRKKITPRWLSITRKVMVYIGGSTFLVMVLAKLFPNKDAQDFALQCYLTGLAAVQAVCDFTYQKEEENVYRS